MSDVFTIDEKENKQSSLVNIPNETKDNYSICYNMKNFLFNPDNDIHLYFHILGIYAFKLYKETKIIKLLIYTLSIYLDPKFTFLIIEVYVMRFIVK